MAKGWTKKETMALMVKFSVDGAYSDSLDLDETEAYLMEIIQEFKEWYEMCVFRFNLTTDSGAT